MNANAIDRLIRAQVPIQAYQMRAGASLCLLRQDLEALGIDPEALESALGRDVAPLPIFDAGLSAEPDVPVVAASAFDAAGNPVTLVGTVRVTERVQTCNSCSVLAEKMASRDAELAELLGIRDGYQAALDNQRRRVSRLVAIARSLRAEWRDAKRERAAITAEAFKTEQERDRLLAEFNARGGND